MLRDAAAGAFFLNIHSGMYVIMEKLFQSSPGNFTDMPRRTHEDALNTRKAILNSARRLFSRRGFERTSLSDIAKYAGVTRGAIYWHFEDKGELLCALCEEINKEKKLEANLEDASRPDEKDPLECLRRWLLTHGSDESVQFFTSSLFALIEHIMASGSNSSNAAVRARFLQLYENQSEEIYATLANAVSKGQLPRNLDLNLAKAVLAIFIVGYIDLLRRGHADAILARYPDLVDIIINSMLPRLTVRPR